MPGSAVVLRALSAAILGCTSSLDGTAHGTWVVARDLIRFSRANLRLAHLWSLSAAHEIVDSPAGHLHTTFFREYLGDIPIRPPLAPKVLDEFAVWLKAGARRLVRQFVQKFLQVDVHGNGV